MSANERGDDWQPSECPGCQEHKEHLAQLEDALAASKAAMILMRARLAAMMDALHFAGWGVA
jgi:hypothetical protein